MTCLQPVSPCVHMFLMYIMVLGLSYCKLDDEERTMKIDMSFLHALKCTIGCDSSLW